MDEYSSKRVHVGIVRKGPGVVLRDSMKNRDQSNQYGNRPGCTGRICSSSGAQVGCSNKASAKRPFRGSSGKEVVGSSSAIRNLRKSFPEPFGNLSSKLDTDSSENGSSQDELEELEFISPPGMFHPALALHVKSESSVPADAMLVERGSCSTDSNTKSKKNPIQTYGVDNQDVPVSMRSRSLCQASNGGTSRYSSRNLACNSVSGIIPSDSSSLEQNLVRRKNVTKKLISDGENSSCSRGKKVSGTSCGQNHGYRRGISICDQREGRNMFHRQNVPSSIGTQSLTTVCGGARHSYQGISDDLSSPDSLMMTSWMPQPNVSSSSNASSSRQFPSESQFRHHMTYPEPVDYSRSLLDIRQATPAEAGISSTSTNLNSIRCHNVNGIAEVLLALERIEQEEELTYEQAILLETSMFLNSLNIYDQHRDMRLDIDNMTYEELLDLEERMGTVSTALSEEALTECLNRSIYQSKPQGGASTSSVEDLSDVKCCICQEEYVTGDEVGRLHCEHKYHVACIQQWLRLKNWCPICKASAAASPIQMI